MRCKVSKYTIYEEYDGAIDVFNSFTGAILRLKDKEIIKRFMQIVSSNASFEYDEKNQLYTVCLKMVFLYRKMRMNY